MRGILSAVFLLILSQYSFATLTLHVEPKTSDCFFVDAKAGDRVKLVFFVVRGGLLDIDLRVVKRYNKINFRLLVLTGK
jgi:hypothetical protein